MALQLATRSLGIAQLAVEVPKEIVHLIVIRTRLCYSLPLLPCVACATQHAVCLAEFASSVCRLRHGVDGLFEKRRGMRRLILDKKDLAEPQVRHAMARRSRQFRFQLFDSSIQLTQSPQD